MPVAFRTTAARHEGKSTTNRDQINIKKKAAPRRTATIAPERKQTAKLIFLQISAKTKQLD